MRAPASCAPRGPAQAAPAARPQRRRPRGADPATLGAVLAAGLGLAGIAAAPAAAQVSGSLGIVSDYRLRGAPLTDGEPAMAVGFGYDHPSGAYAGATVIGEDSSGHSARVLGHAEYVGFARTIAGGPTWDVGLNNVDYGVYGDRRFALRYTEAYVGVSQHGLSARLSYSPNYLQGGVNTLYGEVNGVMRPAEAWRLSAHGGVFHRLDAPGPDGHRTRYDLRLAATREFDNLELEVGWVIATPSRPRPQSQVLFGATVFF
jgi:uncharacterized protein (TIGR02001 family)